MGIMTEINLCKFNLLSKKTTSIIQKTNTIEMTRAKKKGEQIPLYPTWNKAVRCCE
jgi:hypothetical protein